MTSRQFAGCQPQMHTLSHPRVFFAVLVFTPCPLSTTGSHESLGLACLVHLCLWHPISCPAHIEVLKENTVNKRV